MAKKYPYIPSMPPLKKFIEKIPTMGIPKKIIQSTLPQMGFKSSNARYIPSVLKFIGFIDAGVLRRIIRISGKKEWQNQLWQMP